VLLFGRERSRLFPDAWIQAGRFAGTQKVTILDQLEIRCYPIPAIEAAAGFVRKHSLHGAEIGPVRRTERWNLPPIAVREALVNAVVHADYSQKGAPIRVAIFDDRLEVENPGILLSGLTIEDLRRGVSRLRNRVLGRVFHELSLIEQWGSGVLRMTEACREAGLPPPLLEEIGTRFRVTLFTAPSTHAGGTARDVVDQSNLGALASEGRSTRAIAAAISLTPRATRTRLIRLVEQGLVREIGSSPQDPKRLYHLSESFPPSAGEIEPAFRYPDSNSRPEPWDSTLHEHEIGFPAPGKRRRR
jgi:predicted HTH transcriptional regulator